MVAAAGGAAGAATALDGTVSRAALSAHGSLLDSVAEVLSATGRSLVPLAILAAVGIIGAVKRRHLIELAARGVLVLILAAILAQGLKAVIRRPRPILEDTPSGRTVGIRAGSANSMPSGHTLAAFALAAALSAGIGRWRIALYGWAVLVGLSRLMGAHWASDVVAGALVGLALAASARRLLARPGAALAGLLAGARPPWLAERRIVPLTALLLLGAALPMALVGNRQAKLLDRDEPRFAQTAREMLQRGDFVVPHLNGAVRFEKPPLSYWAICGAYAVLGPHAFSARLPSALFGAAACLLTYAIGLRLFERRTAFLGAVILLCSLQWVVEAKVATADALLLALLLAALYAAIRLRDGDRPLVWAPVLYVALGLSNLAKGPVGILLVALALGTFLLVTRDRPLLRRLHVLPGLLIVAAVNVPWLVLVQVRTGGAFLETTLEEHFLAHATRGKEGHYAIFLVYVPYLVAFFFPWSILLPGALARAWRERREDRSRGLAWAGASPLFFLCWALSGMLLFSLIGTKLPHYLLPLYPAFALLVARAALCEVDGEHRLLRGRLGMAGGVSMILLSLGVLAGLPLAITGAGFPLVPALVAGVLGLTLTTGVVGAVILMRRRRALPALWALATGAYLSWFGFFHLVLAPLTEYGLSEQVAPALNACRRRGLPVASLGYGEPSLVFLMDGLHILEDRDKLVSLVAREGRLACLITREEYALLKRDPDLAFRSPSFFRGFNFAKWRWVEARLVEVKMRGPPASTRPAPEAPGVPRAGGTVSGRGPTSRR